MAIIIFVIKRIVGLRGGLVKFLVIFRFYVVFTFKGIETLRVRHFSLPCLFFIFAVFIKRIGTYFAFLNICIVLLRIKRFILVKWIVSRRRFLRFQTNSNVPFRRCCRFSFFLFIEWIVPFFQFNLSFLI